MITSVKRVIAGLALLIMASQALAEQRLTILHTNDLHSHLLGAAPNVDYSPDAANNDATRGGFARIATVIKEVRRQNPHPVLVVDAGDFLMGSLFHMLSREYAYELRLLYQMGYDALTLGNHEFDLKPDGLVRILTSAQKYNQLPPIVASNVVFSLSDEDDRLEAAYSDGLIKPYQVIEKGKLRIGVFGLMGNDAAEVAPFAAPVRFSDPLESARKWVSKLRNEENVDLVLCLSHSGLSPDPDRSEDEILAREVDGIDIIISGHTHSRMEKALQINETIVVQAWEYGKEIGILDLVMQNGKAKLTDYRAQRIDDAITGDAQITRTIVGYQSDIDREFLGELNLGFNQIIASTDFDLTITASESNLGNLITDAICWDVNRSLKTSSGPTTGVSVGVISNGVIRDPILAGKSGKVAVCDVFRAIPLGIGFDADQTMGYPLIALYLYPAELKKTLEILTSIYPLKGSDYFLQVSGLRFAYNPNRMIFDRVTEIWMGNERRGYKLLDYSKSNRDLIGVTTDIYNATFLKVIGDFTHGILDMVPKFSDGSPIEDLRAARVDSDPERPGIQELKEWQAVMAYIQQMPDIDRDGVPNISAEYRSAQNRQIVAASLNPFHLLRGGNWVTWTAFTTLILSIAFTTMVVVFALRRFGFLRRGD